MGGEADAAALDRLAAAAGSERAYHDGTGAWRRAPDEAVVAVLRSLGHDIRDASDARAIESAREGTALPRRPAVTAACRAAEPATVALDGWRARDGRLHLELEHGPGLVVPAEEQGDCVAATLPGLPVGYHHLRDEAGHEALLMAAPQRLPDCARSWALFAPLYGLGRPGARGFATYADLARLAAWMREVATDAPRKNALVATLPLLDTFLDDPFEPSPYSPVSRAFWSELYVDPGMGTGAMDGPAVDPARIDYRAAMQARRLALAASLARADLEGGPGRDAFEAALAADDAGLASWAAFRAALERLGPAWPSWPSRARDGALRAGIDYHGDAFRLHAWAQWLARRQMTEVANEAAGDARGGHAGLHLDLPLGSHPDGYDTWRRPGEFAMGIGVGAPPDAVFDGGQSWGFPPPHPEGARAGGYATLRAALAHHCAHAALLRVDHVMGMHRLFWVPNGFGPAEGVYVHYPAAETWAVLGIEASRGQGGRGTAVVGEDLGTVPDEVRREMEERGALRMHVLPFACGAEGDARLDDPPAASLASLGTHDMEPFAAWWRQATTPRDALAARLGCGTGEAETYAALVSWLGRGPAAVAVGSLEDFWLETRRQNLPGTGWDAGNWQRPFARPFDPRAADARLAGLAARLAGGAAGGAA